MFLSVPSLSVSTKRGKYPDYYLGVFNEAWPGGAVKNFNQVITLACSDRLSQELQAKTRSAIESIASLLGATLVGYQRRAWGKPAGQLGSGAYTDSIQDLPLLGLFKVGKRQDRDVDLDTFKDRWVIIPNSNT